MSMGINIRDPSGNRNDMIANAAKVIGRSKDREMVFVAVYTGKKRIKTVSEILTLSKLKSNVRVLQEAERLVSAEIIKQCDKKIKGLTAYEKIPFYTHNKQAILRLVHKKEGLENFPTKINPRTNVAKVFVNLPRGLVQAKQIYVEDIDSFSKVKKIKPGASITPPYEKDVKGGFKQILGEEGDFRDWGGEMNDFFSGRIMFRGKRMNVAFAFKGRGTKGKLIPKKMGKNSDQIQRLFKSPADIFLIQYHGEIDESIVDQMKSFAGIKSVWENRKIYFGIIDGKDTLRIVRAYSTFFN